MSSDFPPELRAELLDDFYAEADELLGGIRTQLTLLEATLGKSAPEPAAVESIFRGVHSLKGICAMVGLQVAERLAHSAEDFLRQLTRRATALTRHKLDVLVSTTQRLEQMVMAHRLEQALPEARDLEDEFAALTAQTPAAAAAAGTDAAVESAETKRALQLAALVARRLAPWSCTFAPTRELDQRGVNVNAVRNRLSALGEIVSATPAVRGDGSIAFEFLLGFHHPPADLAAWQADGMQLAPIELPAPAADEAQTDGAPQGAGHASATALSIAPSHIVRVDLSRLDDLMRIASELVIHRSRLEDRISQFAGASTELKEANHALGRSLRQLRSAITRVRLVPVAEIFTRMPFVVRDLARETAGGVRLALEGQQTEIDKYLVERLKEPLLHLVRNVVSHGIEPAAERVAAGKPADGTLLLRATTAGDFVVIQVRDDGRGIDPRKVAARAAAQGLAVPEPLDESSLLRLLCAPGFSTREEADRAAGRGFGMTVVYNTVRELGGTLTLETTPGRGTQFTLRLPLTLSIAETIIVSASEQTCAVPQGFVDEIIQVTETDVRTIKEAEVIPYRDGVLPILRLRAMFGIRSAAPRAELSVLVLSSERGSTGLVVDRVHTQREIVVRPMQDPLLQVPGVSGATELGDGRPVLILDPIAITSGVVRPRAKGQPTSR